MIITSRQHSAFSWREKEKQKKQRGERKAAWGCLKKTWTDDLWTQKLILLLAGGNQKDI